MSMISLRAWFWRMALDVALIWCRWCRRWHKKADNLCWRLVMQVEGEQDSIRDSIR